MWTTEYRHEADVPVDALWSVWTRVLAGELELPGGDRYEPQEPLGVGARIVMTPAGQEGIEIVVTRWEPPHVQADRAEYGGVELTFTHSFVSAGPGGEGNAVIIRLDIDGPRADEIGPGIGSQIAADFPQTAEALVRAAKVTI